MVAGTEAEEGLNPAEVAEVATKEEAGAGVGVEAVGEVAVRLVHKKRLLELSQRSKSTVDRLLGSTGRSRQRVLLASS